MILELIVLKITTMTNFEKINQPRPDGYPRVKEIKAEKEPSLVDFYYMDKPLKEINYE